MNVFCISTNENYDYIDIDSDLEIRRNYDFGARKSFIKEWRPFRIKLEKKVRNKGILFKQDCFGVINNGGSFIISKNACEVLKDILDPRGEFLGVYSGKNHYEIYNCLNFIDPFDKSKNTIEEIKNEILFYDRCLFIEEKLENEYIFKDKDILTYANTIFVTDKFVNRVIEADLKGFRFCHMWSSEGELIQPRYIET